METCEYKDAGLPYHLNKKLPMLLIRYEGSVDSTGSNDFLSGLVSGGVCGKPKAN